MLTTALAPDEWIQNHLNQAITHSHRLRSPPSSSSQPAPALPSPANRCSHHPNGSPYAAPPDHHQHRQHRAAVPRRPTAITADEVGRTRRRVKTGVFPFLGYLEGIGKKEEVSFCCLLTHPRRGCGCLVTCGFHISLDGKEVAASRHFARVPSHGTPSTAAIPPPSTAEQS